MLKKALLFLSAIVLGAGAANAQRSKCGTDEVHKLLKERFPQIAITEAELEAQIANGLSHLNLNNLGKSTADTSQLNNPDFIYHIPIVIHLVHDYNFGLGPNSIDKEYLSDNYIYEAVKEWNTVFAKENPDTIDVIPPFKKYIGNAHIKLHLATKDPNGNPTTGITRHFSHQFKGGSSEAKLGGWPNTSYMNIWVVRSMNADNKDAAAFALKPAAGQQLPWWDGVITVSRSFNEDKTINHELAHTFNIDHVWGGTNNPYDPTDPSSANVPCGDDGVDDTPPTRGHGPSFSQSGCNHPAGPNSVIYDDTCAFGYLKVYPSAIPGVDSIVDYPDTTNAQNIMDYTYCSRMFTKGQVYRMHEALNSNTAGRNNLWSTANLAVTGALDPKPDLAPIADYSIGRAFTSTVPLPAANYRMQFMCANIAERFSFIDASWRDTITSRTWSFDKPTMNFNNEGDTVIKSNFTETGWVTGTLTVTSNAGTNTISKKLVYAADGVNKINPVSNGFYFQEFTPNADLDKWPIFNYYENDFKWKINNNTGYYDKSCIQYTGYDTRQIPQSYIGTSQDDYDDFFSPSFDLSGMQSGDCNLNYMFSGAAMSGFTSDMKDLFMINYSTDCGKTWDTLNIASEDEIFNQGNYTLPYQPGWTGEWELMSLNIPQDARVNGVFFRFRYLPRTNANGIITSNNFYVDRINISNFPLGANTLISEERKIVVAPNPTSGSSNVIISGEAGAQAEIVVTDITGKLVYQTSEKLTGNYNTIAIPAEVLSAKGFYMVNVKTGAQSHTEKLVVY